MGEASEIAEKTGLTTKAVGSIIGYNLLQYIERKKFDEIVVIGFTCTNARAHEQ